MADEDEGGVGEWIGRHPRTTGALALGAWLALLWFMFGDVL